MLLAWHVTTVKLHMETEGALERLSNKGRQQLVLVKNKALQAFSRQHSRFIIF